jgi:hypothetical protein
LGGKAGIFPATSIDALRCSMLNEIVPDPSRSAGSLAPSETDLLLAARPHCRIVHHVPGRIRLRFDPFGLQPVLRGRTATLDGILGRIRGVRSTELNLAACSLIVHYDHDLLPPATFDQLLAGSPEAAGALLAELLGA